jgi:hypothetical protein
MIAVGKTSATSFTIARICLPKEEEEEEEEEEKSYHGKDQLDCKICIRRKKDSSTMRRVCR